MGIAILFAIVTISNSCTKDTTYNTPGSGGGPKGTGPGTNEVWIQGMAFSPADITVTAGTTITWTNKENLPHTVTRTDSPGSFDSGTLGNNGIFSLKFNTVGTFTYFCKIHSTMTGSVTVK